MLNVVWEDIKHYFNLSLAHRLNDILPVVTKEEETTTLTSTRSSAERLFAIEFRRQTFFKKLHAKFVHIEQLCKLVQAVVRDLDLRIYNLACLFIKLGL